MKRKEQRFRKTMANFAKKFPFGILPGVNFVLKWVYFYNLQVLNLPLLAALAAGSGSGGQALLVRRAGAAGSQMALGLCGGCGQPPRLNARKRFLGVGADDPVWNLWAHTSYVPGGFLSWRVPKPHGDGDKSLEATLGIILTMNSLYSPSWGVWGCSKNAKCRFSPGTCRKQQMQNLPRAQNNGDFRTHTVPFI